MYTTLSLLTGRITTVLFSAAMYTVLLPIVGAIITTVLPLLNVSAKSSNGKSTPIGSSKFWAIVAFTSGNVKNANPLMLGTTLSITADIEAGVCVALPCADNDIGTPLVVIVLPIPLPCTVQ